MADENPDVVQVPYELTLGPKDKLVLHCEQALPDEAVKFLTENVSEFLVNPKQRGSFAYKRA